MINFLSIMLFLANFYAFSAKQVTLQLISAEKIISSEASDELYFSITGFPSNNKSFHNRIPNFPKFWIDDNLKLINNLDIWSGKLHNNNSISLQISLIEHDMPPFNNDDLIGTIFLNINNKDNIILNKWQLIKNYNKNEIFKTSNNRTIKYTLKGNNSIYQLFFKIITSDNLIQ